MNSLRMPKLLAFLCFGLPLAASLPVLAVAQTLDAGANHTVRNIVLVHGAWANGSSWSLVIPLLEARGFHVVKVRQLSSPQAASNPIYRPPSLLFDVSLLNESTVQYQKCWEWREETWFPG
jgi:pimeloyl-ACP methyl ester carboxylesterase